MTPLWLRVDRAPLTLARLPWRVALCRAQGVVRPAPAWPVRRDRRRAWRETLALLALLLVATAVASDGWWLLNRLEGLWRW
jgi:hypothetical protein